MHSIKYNDFYLNLQDSQDDYKIETMQQQVKPKHHDDTDGM